LGGQVRAQGPGAGGILVESVPPVEQCCNCCSCNSNVDALVVAGQDMAIPYCQLCTAKVVEAESVAGTVQLLRNSDAARRTMACA
jgi:hypothetical protein